MADGSQTIEIDAELADALRAEAEAAGMSFEAYVKDLLSQRVACEPDGFFDRDPEIDRRIAEKSLRTGEYYDFEEVSAWMKSWGTDYPLPKPKLRRR